MNFAIIGCGKISERHAMLLKGNDLLNAKLVACCDSSVKKCKEFKEKHKIIGYYNISELIKNNTIDVYVITTPSGTHCKIVIQLAKLGKAIVVEKPMALKVSDAQKMIDTCKQYKSKLFVVKQNRFNLPVAKLKESIQNKRLGSLFLGTARIRWCRNQEYYDQAKWRGTKRFDGGVLMNQASHHVDLLIWLMGDVKSVYAKSIKALAKIETEDTAIVILKFKSGALGCIEATTATRPKDLEGSISILGENGSVVIGGFSVNEIITWNLKNDKITKKEKIADFKCNPHHKIGYAHKKYYEHVLENVTNNLNKSIDGTEGIKSLKVICAIYDSINSNKEIYI